MTAEKQREIVVRGKEGGSPNPDFQTMGLHARDTQTHANMWVPTPIRRNGVEVTGREAAEHVASLLLLVQGAHGKFCWDRDTGERTVFVVFRDRE